MNEKDKKELMFMLPRLKRYCYGLTGNKDQGDDLLHSSVVKILSKFNLLKIENLQAYMYKIISNLWKDELRKKYKPKEPYTRGRFTVTTSIQPITISDNTTRLSKKFKPKRSGHPTPIKSTTKKHTRYMILWIRN